MLLLKETYTLELRSSLLVLRTIIVYGCSRRAGLGLSLVLRLKTYISCSSLKHLSSGSSCFPCAFLLVSSVIACPFSPLFLLKAWNFCCFLKITQDFFCSFLPFYLHLRCDVDWFSLEGCSHLLACETILFLSLARNFVSHSRSFVALSSYFIPLSHLFVLYLIPFTMMRALLFGLALTLGITALPAQSTFYRVLWHSCIPTVKVSLTFYRCCLSC